MQQELARADRKERDDTVYDEEEDPTDGDWLVDDEEEENKSEEETDDDVPLWETYMKKYATKVCFLARYVGDIMLVLCAQLCVSVQFCVLWAALSE